MNIVHIYHEHNYSQQLLNLVNPLLHVTSNFQKKLIQSFKKYRSLSILQIYNVYLVKSNLGKQRFLQVDYWLWYFHSTRHDHYEIGKFTHNCNQSKSKWWNYCTKVTSQKIAIKCSIYGQMSWMKKNLPHHSSMVFLHTGWAQKRLCVILKLLISLWVHIRTMVLHGQLWQNTSIHHKLWHMVQLAFSKNSWISFFN